MGCCCPAAGFHFVEASLGVQLQRHADAQAVLKFCLSVSSMVTCSVVKVVTRIVLDKAFLRFVGKFQGMPDDLANNLLCVHPRHRGSMQGLPRPSAPFLTTFVAATTARGANHYRNPNLADSTSTSTASRLWSSPTSTAHHLQVPHLTSAPRPMMS